VRRRGGWIKGRDGTWMAGWKGGRWCCAVLYVGRKLAGSFWSLRRERLAGNREGRVAGRRRKSFVAFRSIAKHTRGRRDTRLGPVLWLRMMPAGLSDMQGLKAGKWGRAHRRRVETGGRLDDLNDENMICWTLLLYLYTIMRLQPLYGHYSYPGTEGEPLFSYSTYSVADQSCVRTSVSLVARGNR
jgi:hypothetical protein